MSDYAGEFGQINGLTKQPWHLVEMHGRLDTSCTDVTKPFGCNGVFKLWLDEVLVTQYTNVNFSYVLTNGRMRFGSHLVFPQSYYRGVAPPWEMELAWDNLAISNTGIYIGPAANENSRGVADPASPYRLFMGIEAFLGRRVGPDCAPYGYLKYRSGGTLQTVASTAPTSMAVAVL